uniref:Vacuolar ATPase assembly integral membrane protein VMA21 homolog n=1 Tax=Globisporangium ultimum (strain ATCC 200006 / CBS 805.95 / DAOM BR144) TaxID=431595 RepID=K3WK36_GLOUD
MATTTSLRGMQDRAARNRAHNSMVWRKLLFFTVLMVTLPLGTFFGLKRYIGPNNPNADSWSGFAAVLMVNIVIGVYILSAWSESDEKEVAPPVGRWSKAKDE